MERSQWMICTTHMLLEVYLLMHVALIPVLIQEFQLSVLEASIVASFPSLVQLLTNIPAGFLAERFSIKSLLFASMATEGLSALLISQTSQFWMLVLGISLLKIASPLYHISGLSQLSRLAKPDRMNRTMGVHNAFGNLGAALGVVSLAVFLTTLGWRWTYLFWSVPVLIWGLMVSIFLPVKKEQNIKAEKKVNKGGLSKLFFAFSFSFSFEFLIFLLVIGFREMGITGSSTFMTTYFVDVRGLSESTASLIFGLGPFAGVIGSLNGGYLGERLGASRALSWTIVCCAVSLFALSLVAEPFLVVILYVVFAFFNNAAFSSLNVLVTDLTHIGGRGLSFSVYFFVEGLVLSVAPALAAGIIELSGVWFVFPFSIAFLMVSLLTLHFVLRVKRR
ncbi:MAG: MFS transporter [Candidatus Bathycorpusculaceae bacterium]